MVVAGPNGDGAKPKLVSTEKMATSLANLNITGLSGNRVIKQHAIETLRKYGVGPPGLYGFLGTSRSTSFHLMLSHFSE